MVTLEPHPKSYSLAGQATQSRRAVRISVRKGGMMPPELRTYIVIGIDQLGGDISVPEEPLVGLHLSVTHYPNFVQVYLRAATVGHSIL